MTELFKHLFVFRDMKTELLQKIQYCFVTQHYWSKKIFALWVNDFDQVFSSGDNSFGQLGTGDRISHKDYFRIEDLCKEDICEFYQGNNCIFAKNKLNEVFGWGLNNISQLGLEHQDPITKVYEPIRILKDLIVDQITCADVHNLCLTTDGKVYAWGLNCEGQCAGLDDTLPVEKPTEIPFDNPIIYIHCYCNSSFAISVTGTIFFWGENIWGRFSNENNYLTFKPIKLEIQIPSIKKLICDSEYIFTINQSGDINYFQGDDEIESISKDKFYNVIFDNREYILCSQKNIILKIFKSGEELQLEKVPSFQNFDQYFAHYYHITNGTAKVLNKDNIYQGKYEGIFEEIEQIGRGLFGDVFKVKKKSNFYAIKKLKITEKIIVHFYNNLKEAIILSQLNPKYVVKYFGSWIEKIVIFEIKTKHIFIQMEFCSQNLKDVIKLMADTSGCISEDRFKTFKYFIWCQLFKELTECVHYLHSLNPPLIHRDLRPKHILISDGLNGRFLKLCGFQLATFHDKSEHTRNVGSQGYIAPEVKMSEEYNQLSDIYSLAIIGLEIFQIGDSDRTLKEERINRIQNDLNKCLEENMNTTLETNYKLLIEMLVKCLFADDYHNRPDSKQLLKYIDKFSLNKSDILQEQNIHEFMSELEDLSNTNKDNFLLKYFEAKTKN